MKTHIELRTSDVVDLLNLAEGFIIEAVRQNPGAYVKEDALIRALRHDIVEQSRPNPKQKELKIAAKPAARGPQRDARSHVTKVLVASQQGRPVRKAGQQVKQR